MAIVRKNRLKTVRENRPETTDTVNEPTMKIEILGPGCPKCDKTESNVRDTLASLGMDAEVQKVTDQDEIVERGVMMTPAVAIDGEVKISGKVPRRAQLESLLQG